MPDKKPIRGPEAKNRINIHEQYEVEYWTKTLHVTPQKLKQLVKDHGDSLKAVKQALEEEKPAAKKAG